MTFSKFRDEPAPTLAQPAGEQWDEDWYTYQYEEPEAPAPEAPELDGEGMTRPWRLATALHKAMGMSRQQQAVAASYEADSACTHDLTGDYRAHHKRVVQRRALWIKWGLFAAWPLTT